MLTMFVTVMMVMVMAVLSGMMLVYCSNGHGITRCLWVMGDGRWMIGDDGVMGDASDSACSQYLVFAVEL